MAFTSFKFVVFFAIVYALLWLIKWVFGKKNSYSAIYKAFLLIGSYAFMAIADWRFAVCIFALTAVTYFSALWKNKKGVLAAGIALTIGRRTRTTRLRLWMTVQAPTKPVSVRSATSSLPSTN